jgi:nucleotide-binding universal stress UspA family protein
MYTVLLGIDESVKRATSQAKAIADIPAPDGEVEAVLLHDFTDNPEGASAIKIRSVKRANEILTDADIEVSIEETSGKPASEILRVAEEINADLISVSGRKRTPTGKALFGSVTQSVILETERPVMVVPAEESE